MSNLWSRRAVLAAGASVAATGLATSCSTEQDAGEQQQLNQQVELPTYTKFGSVQPDLPGDDILLDGFLSYPTDPQPVTQGPPGDGKPISFLTTIPTAIPPGVDQNAYWQEMNKRVGSELQLTLIGDDYANKFATTIAGGDLPDALNVPTGTAQLPRLLENTCVDLTELLSGDAVNAYPALANLGPDLWRGCVFNGKIYGIPVPRAMARTQNPLYRADVLAQRGISATEITDFETFFALCRDLTDQRGNKWAWDAVPTQYLHSMLGLPNSWSEEGGRFSHAYEHENYVAGVEAARTMVEAGVVNPDGFTTGLTARKQWITGGSCVFTRDSMVAWNQFYVDGASIEGFEMRMLDTPGFDGGDGVVWMGSALNNITAFSKDSEHDVATSLAVANFMAAPFGSTEYMFKKFGLEGEHHTLSGSDPVLTQSGTLQTGLGLQYLADPPIALYLPGEPEVVKAQHAVQTAFKPKLAFDASYGLYSDSRSSKGGQIDGVINDLTTQMILGREPVSRYADALATWRTNGGDQIRSEYEAAFAAANG